MARAAGTPRRTPPAACTHVCVRGSGGSSRMARARALHRSGDPSVATAAADVAGKPGADRGLIWVWIDREQRRGREHHPGRAVATLHRALAHERLLHDMQLAGRRRAPRSW